MSKRNLWLTLLMVVQVVVVLTLSSRGLTRRSEQVIAGGVIASSGVTAHLLYTEPRAARKDDVGQSK